MELKQETINKRIAILAATDTKSAKYTDLNEIKNEILNKSTGRGTIDKLLKPYFRKLTYIQLEECARNKSFWVVDSKEYALIRINYLLKVLKKGLTVNTPNWNSAKKEEVKSMCSYIRENRGKFKVDNKGVYTGNVPQGSFKYKSGFVKHMKNGHHRTFGRELWINGNLHSIGGHLHLLDRALSHKKRGRKSTKKEIINDFYN